MRFPTTAMIVLSMFLTAASAAAVPEDIQPLVDAGDFVRAQELLRTRAADPEMGDGDRRSLLFEAERLDRIRLDFRLDDAAVLEQVRAQIPDATAGDVDRWREAGLLENRPIDGQRRYFNRAVANLFRLSAEARNRRPAAEVPARPTGDREVSIEDRMARFLAARRQVDSPLVEPRRYRVTYRLTVKPDSVPAGETIRCWLVYPRETPSQRDVVLLRTSPAEHVLAPNEALQRSIYMEQPARAGEPAVFEAAYEYTAFARCEFIDPDKVEPYDVRSRAYREFTAERAPHLAFTPELRQLAASIVGDETNPYLKAKKIYGYIDQNIRYTSALEYSTIPNLSQYCAANGRGDCGIQGMLFIALCRIAGVPAKWQSGWSVLPERTGMHDWCEFYVEPYGWLPADPSRGLRPVDNQEVRWFNFGNMDPYRLVANDDFGTEFVPAKEHFRSEPIDFQRGEVEWRGGNLYFDQWDYKIEVEHLSSE